MVKRTKPAPEPWPPVELRLPDSIEEIERGRPEPRRQRTLFDGDSRETWLTRLTGGTAAKPAPRIAPSCVSGGVVDTLDLGNKRPVQEQPAGFGGA